MPYDVIDADGHVTETWEQIARHLEEPYRRRPLLSPFFPQDGWDRRLIGTRGDWAGDAKSWEEALDAGGMSISVLYPTLGLMMPFLRDAEWAVALTRAYNTMPQAIQWVGDDRIFYASDFPHWDHSDPKSVKELADRADLTDVQKRRILADNARRFYALA